MASPVTPFGITSLSDTVDDVAVDGSAIQLLLSTGRASMAHGTLAVGQTSHAVRHRTVDELWLVVAGTAEIWCHGGEDDSESLVTATAGDALTIPLGSSFQYRTVGDTPFEFVMCTTPPWPGDQEAILVPGPWSA